ncbi:hypothetical protein ACTFIZ_005799 [Dictyostelium cf. discoideum]
MKILILLFLCILSLSYASNLDTIKTNPTECEACQIVIGYVENLVLHSNKTQGEIEKELDKLCNMVSPRYKPTCDSIVSVYTTEIIQLILNKETPDLICKEIKVCVTEWEVNKTKLFSKIAEIALKEIHSVAQKSKSPQLIQNNLKSTTECEICQAFVSKLESYISTNKSEEEIMEDLDNACDYMKSFEQQCKQMVQDYVPELIEIMSTTEDPDKVCSQISLCPNDLSFKKELKNQRLLKKNIIN